MTIAILAIAIIRGYSFQFVVNLFLKDFIFTNGDILGLRIFWQRLGSAVLIVLLAVAGVVQDEAGAEMRVSQPLYSEIKIEKPGPMRIANRVGLAQVDDTTMLQYYERSTGKQWLYFSDGISSSHVILPKFGGIQSDRPDFRGTRFDQVEHVLPSLKEVWIFSEAPTKTGDARLGYMSPVMISRYALTGSPLPTSVKLMSSAT